MRSYSGDPQRGDASGGNPPVSLLGPSAPKGSFALDFRKRRLRASAGDKRHSFFDATSFSMGHPFGRFLLRYDVSLQAAANG
jgi:hypothetical protein